MSETFRCDDKEMLVAYLYGEIDGDGRREVERHLRTCAACTRESEALQSVRHDLQTWVPPAPDLGFSIVRAAAAPAPVLTSPRWASLRALPAWAQVAAAVLVLGVSAGLANLHVTSGENGLVITTGWMSPPPAVAVAAAPAANDEWRQQLAALEQSLRSELAAQEQAIKVASTAPGADSGGDTSAVLRRVQAMLDASESRQRQEMAYRLAQAERSWNLRRQTDLMNINKSFGTLQGRTFAVQAGQQEMMNQLRRVNVATTPPPNQ